VSILRDAMDPERALALEATLDRPTAGIVMGAQARPLRHWLYFWHIAPRHNLGRDGHLGLDASYAGMRRMWAGSRLEFHQPLIFGEAAEKVATTEKVEDKVGRSGKLRFVTVKHVVSQKRQPVLTDYHDLVYRAEDSVLAAPEPAPVDHVAEETWNVDTTILFRYSALTFNGHRIHYDRDYTKGIEGYRALVVHGPLLATLAVDFACAQMPGLRLARYNFRNRRPIMDDQGFHIRCRPAGEGKLAVWIADADGALALQAEAEFV